MPKKGSPGAIAHLERVIAYHKDPNRGPYPPMAPSVDVAVELARTAREMMAIFLDYKLTGEMHPDNPCPEAVIASCDLAEAALDGNYPAMIDEVMERFGWKGRPDAGT